MGVSAVRVPLYTDKITATQQRLSFARVCIEVDVISEILKSIEVEMKNGKIVHVFTEVSWMPQKCGKCKILGHTDKACSKKETQKWIPKVQDKNGVDEVKAIKKDKEAESDDDKDVTTSGNLVLSESTKD
ncbi:hypothetical protein PTKIN_Ptkin04bG0060800 [Pterospermum kingtungense]